MSLVPPFSPGPLFFSRERNITHNDFNCEAGVICREAPSTLLFGTVPHKGMAP